MARPRILRRIGQLLLLVLLVLTGLVIWKWKSDLPLAELKKRYGAGNSLYIDVDGLEVHYRDEGKGPPIVLLHGTGSSLHTWDAWVKALESERRVIRLDMPGFGLTGPAPNEDYRLSAYVELLDRFTTKLGLSSFALAGNSLGGTIAWRYASAHPTRVSLLVLVDSGGYPQPGKPPLAFRLGGMPGISWVAAHLDPRFLVEKTVRMCYGDPSRLTPEVLERYYELTMRPGNRAAFGARTAVAFEDRTTELRNLRMPVLVLWGEKDALLPVADAKRFAAAIPGSTLKTYADLGHVPMEEDGARTAADVLTFLRGR